MTAVFLGMFAVLFISWLQTVSYGSRAARHHKSDLPDWYRPNPYYLMFQPDKLTGEGLRQRKLFLIWLGVFIGMMLAVGVMAFIYEQFVK
jgi:hypothetical protein